MQDPLISNTSANRSGPRTVGDKDGAEVGSKEEDEVSFFNRRSFPDEEEPFLLPLGRILRSPVADTISAVMREIPSMVRNIPSPHASLLNTLYVYMTCFPMTSQVAVKLAVSSS